MTDRRFIEESFPVKEVSAISAKEKNIRQGHISTLHIWWARRPLAASRATAYAALVPPAEDELGWQHRRDFIVDLSKWENSLNQPLLQKARRDILEAHAQRLSAERGEAVTVEDIEAGRAPRPRVLDPFSGGGAIPLEALRLGCETYASDYNPVAVLLLKATLEYPQKHGRATVQAEQSSFLGETVTRTRAVNPLWEAVKKWGSLVLEESREELASFYPADPDGSSPGGYIWARTVPCQNPSCGTQIPIMRQFWLARTARKKVALCPQVIDGQVGFRIVGSGYAPWPEGFNPDIGTVARAVVTCPACGMVMDAKTTRRLFQEGKAGQRLVAVVLKNPSRKGKVYRLSTERDIYAYQEAEIALKARRDQLMSLWGLDPVPDEPLQRVPITFGVINVWVYGMNNWGSLFNARQCLTLITFAEKVREAYERMLAEGIPAPFAGAITTYLALAVDRIAIYQTTLGYWHNTRELVNPGMGRQAIAMTWDYAEGNAFGGNGDWGSAIGWILKVIEHCSRTPSSGPPVPLVRQCSAAQLPMNSAYFDAVFTDPPYYDNVPYSYLSDFFYVWLKRTVGHLHPDLFSTPLAPRAGEIVAYTQREGGREAGGLLFEENLKRALQEIHRVLKPGGVAIVVYAYKSTGGWETLINSLLDSGLVATGAWPLDTEMEQRLRAKGSAALASSIYILARKLERQPTGFYAEVREELREHLDAKLQRLWEEGIGGADFFIAAIGSAIEVFGRYQQVIDFEGNVVRADRLLADVRTIATDYAVRQILQDGFAGEVSDLTRLYVLWRWEYGEAQVPFDEARKLAQSCGLDLAREWGRGGFVRKEKEFVRVLGPQRRDLDALEDSHELIDVLHRVLLLWEKGRRAEIVQALALTGFGQGEAFYRVAQAVSETLPNDSKEKKLLDGFLAGRARVRDDVDKATRQERLFE